jgi:hypothetical protein
MSYIWFQILSRNVKALWEVFDPLVYARVLPESLIIFKIEGEDLNPPRLE